WGALGGLARLRGLVEGRPELARDDLGAEARRRVQAAAPRLVLDRGGDVGQAELAHEGAIERRDRHARPEAAEVDGRHGEAGGERVARLAQLAAGQRAVTVEVAVVAHVEQARLRG